VKKPPLTRLAAAVAGLTVLVAIAVDGGAGVAASSSPSPDESTKSIIALIMHKNSGLNSYQAHAVLDLRQVNFPWLHPVLEGTEYYGQPGFTELDFPHTPSYLKGITKVEGTVLSAPRWEHCYNITISTLPEAYVLHMVPKINGEVSTVDVTVGRSDGQLQRFDWYYHDSSDDHISLVQYYGTVYGYSVVQSQTSQISRHHIRAVGQATFSDFQFNVPVPTPTPTPSNPLHQCDN
jgi:hypothetical protein